MLHSLLVVVLLGVANVHGLSIGVDVELGGGGGGGGCPSLCNLDKNLNDFYCDQPLFVTFMPKTDENTLIDNICYTYFPLPDDPNTYQMYISRVYCDGSTFVTSYITTDYQLGVFKAASPFCTFYDTIFGYAGCDTYLVYRCILFGDCDYDYEGVVPVFGLSTQCRAMGLSCLRKVDEIIRDNGLDEQDFYILPMKLPNRCVTSQICINEPAIEEFHEVVEVERPVLLEHPIGLERPFHRSGRRRGVIQI